MLNKKMFKSAVIISAVMLSVGGCAGGCSKQTEPVIADATIETPESEESTEPTPSPSPTVEPTQESIEDIVSSESEDNIASEENTINEENIQSEEVEPDLGYTIIAIDEVTMYATTNANLRGGPGTDYDKVGSLTYAQEIVCNGKVADGDKEWLVLKTEDGSTQMVSAKLVSRTKPQPQSSGGSSSSGGGTTTTPSSGGNGGSGGGNGGSGGSGGSGGGNGGSGGGQPSSGDPDSAPIGGGAFSGLPVSGGYDPNAGQGLDWE